MTFPPADSTPQLELQSYKLPVADLQFLLRDEMRAMRFALGKAPRIPIVLFSREYWKRVINFEALADEAMIEPGDLELFDFADTAEEAWSALVRDGLCAHAEAPQDV